MKWSIQTPNAQRDGRRGHLTRELGERFEAAEVVDRADDARDGRSEHDPAHLAGEVEEREGRDEDAEEDREPAEPRDRPLVQAPRARLVDDAEQARHAADGGCQQHDDPEGDQRAPEDFGVVSKVMEHQTSVSPQRVPPGSVPAGG